MTEGRQKGIAVNVGVEGRIEFRLGLGLKVHMEKPLNTSLNRKAIRHLKSSDRVLAALIEEHGTCTITPALDNSFHALVSSINKSADFGQCSKSNKRHNVRLFILYNQLTFKRVLVIYPV